MIKIIPGNIIVFWITAALFSTTTIAEDMAVENHPALVLVRDTISQISDTINERREELQKDETILREFASKKILQYFDFATMSRFVLGKHWKTASPAQRTQFTTEFQQLLLNTYSSALLEYNAEGIEYYPVEKTSRDELVIIKTSLSIEDNQRIPINYRMYLKEGQWKVVDLLIDNISLVATYRSSFDSEIKKEWPGLDDFKNS